MSTQMNAVLEEFRRFLAGRRLVPERHLTYYVLWIRRFLEFAAPRQAEGFEACRLTFLETLATASGTPDWQVAQADTAIRIYYHQFRKGSVGGDPKVPSTTVSPGSGKPIPSGASETERRLVAALRLRHYSPHRTAIELLYGAGLRLTELCQLRVKDLDFANRCCTSGQPGEALPGKKTGSAAGAAV
ncbi:MAG: tyrosine-type recombinase/integrase [Lentisphaeria bacterium]|jgi:integrase/recombinase XerD